MPVGPSHRSASFARAVCAAVLLAGLAAACHRAPTCDPKAHVKLDYTIKNIDGHDVSLTTYRGKPLLINFWATWCGPCKEEIPALQAVPGQGASGRLRA